LQFCKRRDVTDFSTCRYCGAKYGTSPPGFKDYLTKKVMAVGSVAVCVIGCIAFKTAFKTFLDNVENSVSDAVINNNARPTNAEHDSREREETLNQIHIAVGQKFDLVLKSGVRVIGSAESITNDGQIHFTVEQKADSAHSELLTLDHPMVMDLTVDDIKVANKLD
jgi:hypothetical protein